MNLSVNPIIGVVCNKSEMINVFSKKFKVKSEYLNTLNWFITEVCYLHLNTVIDNSGEIFYSFNGLHPGYLSDFAIDLDEAIELSKIDIFIYNELDAQLAEVFFDNMLAALIDGTLEYFEVETEANTMHYTRLVPNYEPFYWVKELD